MVYSMNMLVYLTGERLIFSALQEIVWGVTVVIDLGLVMWYER